MTVYDLSHRSTYRYGATIGRAYLLIALAPRCLPNQVPMAFSLQCTPEPTYRATSEDIFGNTVVHLTIEVPHDELTITSHARVQVSSVCDLATAGTPWRAVVAATAEDRTPTGLLARDLRLPSKYVPIAGELLAYARPSFERFPSVWDAMADLSQRIHDEFEFSPGFSDVATPLADVLVHRRGVCQDFAHLYIGCARAVGLAARYVSGYIETDPPPGHDKLHGADASHAWCSVFVPSYGWLDVDPTNGQLPPQRHVTIGWGRDYADIAPVRGVLVGPPTTQEVEVSVDVRSHPESASMCAS